MEPVEGGTKLTGTLHDDDGDTDFEFRTSVNFYQKSGSFEALDMCVADEVFFQGQILPLWPYPYVRNSSNWSESSHSRRHSISANFYTHPSPKPYLHMRSISSSFPPRRKSTSSKSVGGSPWGLVQFGLVKTPALLQPKQAGVGYINNGSTSKRHEENDGDVKKTSHKIINRSGLIGMLINKFIRRKSSSGEGDYSGRSLSSLRQQVHRIFSTS